MISQYDEGLLAAWAGKELWENPHSLYAGDMAAFNAWLAGWCHGKKAQPSETKQ